MLSVTAEDCPMPTAALSALPIVNNAIVAITRCILKLPFPANLEVMTILNRCHLSYGYSGKRLPARKHRVVEKVPAFEHVDYVMNPQSVSHPRRTTATISTSGAVDFVSKNHRSTRKTR